MLVRVVLLLVVLVRVVLLLVLVRVVLLLGFMRPQANAPYLYSCSLRLACTPRASDVARAERDARRQPVVLAVFLGGITLAEASALRFLTRSEEQDFVIATTHVCNGRTMLQSLSEPLRRPRAPPSAAAASAR